MAEILSIREFGPIREANIEVKDLTVFVGPQATGKSIAAQLLYFMRGIENLAGRSFQTQADPRERVLEARDAGVAYASEVPLQWVTSALEWWFGRATSVYVTNDTTLCWNPQAPQAETEFEIRWEARVPRLNPALEDRVRSSHPTPRPPPQVYVPAGRALYSFVPSSSATRFLVPGPFQVLWPGFIVMFYESLGAAINHLWQTRDVEEHSPVPDPELKAVQRFVRSRMDRILQGELQYGPDTVALQVGQRVLGSETIAAGQMEIWPFWTIVQETLRSRSYLEATRIYFDEPEAHLHPAAQRDIMESIACLVHQGGQFVLATHSPYVLYTINNALMAQQVLDEGKGLPPGIPPEIALHADQVAAYRFSADGHVYDIMDAEVGLIDEDELDQVADDLGSDFASLQDQLEDMV